MVSKNMLLTLGIDIIAAPFARKMKPYLFDFNQTHCQFSLSFAIPRGYSFFTQKAKPMKRMDETEFTCFRIFTLQTLFEEN